MRRRGLGWGTGAGDGAGDPARECRVHALCIHLCIATWPHAPRSSQPLALSLSLSTLPCPALPLPPTHPPAATLRSETFWRARACRHPPASTPGSEAAPAAAGPPCNRRCETKAPCNRAPCKRFVEQHSLLSEKGWRRWRCGGGGGAMCLPCRAGRVVQGSTMVGYSHAGNQPEKSVQEACLKVPDGRGATKGGVDAAQNGDE